MVRWYYTTTKGHTVATIIGIAIIVWGIAMTAYGASVIVKNLSRGN